MHFGSIFLSKTKQMMGVLVVLTFILAGCGGTPTESGDEQEASTQTVRSDEPADEDSADDAIAAPAQTRVQEETCDWDSPKKSGSAKVPAGQSGDLVDVIVGSWQHTHFDDGAGFEATTYDHRFVFPSPDRMLYCQDVPGATNHAKNAADIALSGTKIELPGGQSYTVTAWDENTMVWSNPVGGGSVYLLQRR